VALLQRGPAAPSFALSPGNRSTVPARGGIITQAASHCRVADRKVNMPHNHGINAQTGDGVCVTPLNNTGIVLLTGAGFSHNFGAPLASELWAMILNAHDATRAPKSRQLLLQNFDFEDVYDRVAHEDDFSQERQAFQAAFERAFAAVDDGLKDFMMSTGGPHPVNLYGVQKLIERFDGSTKQPGFFFTLNQDLFAERHYYNGQRPLMPGIRQRPAWFSSAFGGIALSRDDIVEMDGRPDDLERWMATSGRSSFYFIKLHGSWNWTNRGVRSMVVGKGKTSQLGDEPLLASYYRLFTRVLQHPSSRLLVIGYSFRDGHINRAIGDAVARAGLRVHIVTPEEPLAFHNRVLKEEAGDEIWQGVAGYHRTTLQTLFPLNQAETQEWIALQSNFFGHTH
jgi:hypothetical protein